MNTGRTIRLVINGKSVVREDLRAGVDALRSRGFEVEVRVTWEEGDAERWASRSAESGASVVVACGGDGTVGEVVRGIVGIEPERQPAMAIVPLGAGNDFAAAAGIPLDDVRAALELAVGGHPLSVDSGVVQLDSRSAIGFVNSVTVGDGAAITSDTSDDLKDFMGGVAYYLQTLLRLGSVEPREVRVVAGDFEFSDAAWGVMAVNGPMIGPRVSIAPDAVIDDGKLDVVVVPARSGGPVGEAIEALERLRQDADSELVLRVQAESVRIEGTDLDATVDGELFTGDTFQARVRPASFKCILPSDSPVLSRGRLL